MGDFSISSSSNLQHSHVWAQDLRVVVTRYAELSIYRCQEGFGSPFAAPRHYIWHYLWHHKRLFRSGCHQVQPQSCSEGPPGPRGQQEAPEQGPRRVLCDGETFLTSPAARAAHKKAHVKLWMLPPKSPDLNPVEKYWSWLRRRLRTLDLADLAADRPGLGKTAYKQRVQNVMKSKKSQQVAGSICRGFYKTCQKVKAAKGEMVR